MRDDCIQLEVAQLKRSSRRYNVRPRTQSADDGKVIRLVMRPSRGRRKQTREIGGKVAEEGRAHPPHPPRRTTSQGDGEGQETKITRRGARGHDQSRRPRIRHRAGRELLKKRSRRSFPSDRWRRAPVKEAPARPARTLGERELAASSAAAWCPRTSRSSWTATDGGDPRGSRASRHHEGVRPRARS